MNRTQCKRTCYVTSWLKVKNIDIAAAIAQLAHRPGTGTGYSPQQAVERTVQALLGGIELHSVAAGKEGKRRWGEGGGGGRRQHLPEGAGDVGVAIRSQP